MRHLTLRRLISYRRTSRINATSIPLEQLKRTAVGMASNVPSPFPPLPPMPSPLSSQQHNNNSGGSNNKSSSIPPRRSNDNSNIKGGIPVCHSRKLLPPLITDTDQIESLSQRILEAPVGSLYAYDTTSSNPNSNPDPWTIADETVQTVEALLRGLAARVPQTCWQRWWRSKTQKNDKDAAADADATASVTDVDAVAIAGAMQDLMERLHEEGLSYMQVRADRLQELDTQNDSDSPLATTDDNTVLSENTASRNSADQRKLFLTSKASEDAELEHEANRKYLHDFALPGPTIAMIDAILDVLACGAPQMDTPNVALTAIHDADFLLGLAHTRYQLDCGDKSNDAADTDHHTNPHTRITILTFNACIRLAARLPPSLIASSEPVRDAALSMAMSAFHAADECIAVHRNSASTRYLLQVVAQYFPPSQMRSNIARGLFEQARYRCLINDSVIQAYQQANTPSNGCPVDEAFLRDLAAGDIPVKWRRDSKRRRHHVRSDVY